MTGSSFGLVDVVDKVTLPLPCWVPEPPASGMLVEVNGIDQVRGLPRTSVAVITISCAPAARPAPIR